LKNSSGIIPVNIRKEVYGSSSKKNECIKHFGVIFNYLADSGKIAIDKEGKIAWIWILNWQKYVSIRTQSQMKSSVYFGDEKLKACYEGLNQAEPVFLSLKRSKGQKRHPLFTHRVGVYRYPGYWRWPFVIIVIEAWEIFERVKKTS